MAAGGGAVSSSKGKRVGPGRQLSFHLVFIIQDQGRRRPRRNRTRIDQAPVLVFPPRSDPAVGGAVGRGEAIKAGDDVGPEENMLKTRRRGIGEDAAEALEEPGPDLAEHDVVEGRIAARMDRPVLVEGDCAVFKQ